MTSIELNKIFQRCARDAEFTQWRRDHTSSIRTVYLCEYGTIWRFTLREWWEFVQQTVRCGGTYELPLSRALTMRPRTLAKRANGRLEPVKESARCVHPVDWTLEDWKRELHPAQSGAEPAGQSASGANQPADAADAVR